MLLSEPDNGWNLHISIKHKVCRLTQHVNVFPTLREALN